MKERLLGSGEVAVGGSMGEEIECGKGGMKE